MNSTFNFIQTLPKNNKNHFFGFHDLIAINLKGDKVLGLQNNCIDRPPMPGEKINVGFANTLTGEFITVGTTNAFNYPQGARQQWIDDDNFIVNNQIGNNWGAEIYDCNTLKRIESYDGNVHCITRDGKFGFGIDYERIHRLGGYGYIGLNDDSEFESQPNNKGIWILDLKTKSKKLLISINRIADFEKHTSSSNGFHHFVTHLVLNPSNNRIAFLHRFFLPDGGIRTRLMTIGIDGSDLRCLAVGFLSHFDWKNDSSIFIWGRAGNATDQLRSNPLFSNPLVVPLLNVAKKYARVILKKVSTQLSMTFLLVSDNQDVEVHPIAQGVLTEDGHPMFNPLNRDIIVTDNYPDINKERTLMLYKFATNTKFVLGKFRMLDKQPNMEHFSTFTKGVDKKVLSLISPELYSFTRSGLHCDLHPRWSADGNVVCFDSIHEGSRQLYWLNVKHLL